ANQTHAGPPFISHTPATISTTPTTIAATVCSGASMPGSTTAFAVMTRPAATCSINTSSTYVREEDSGRLSARFHATRCRRTWVRKSNTATRCMLCIPLLTSPVTVRLPIRGWGTQAPVPHTSRWGSRTAPGGQRDHREGQTRPAPLVLYAAQGMPSHSDFVRCHHRAIPVWTHPDHLATGRPLLHRRRAPPARARLPPARLDSTQGAQAWSRRRAAHS